MSEKTPFTIEQFYKFLSEKKLKAGKCLKCKKIYLPPRPLCNECYNEEFEWIELPPRGKLLTYTIIHVAPSQFQQLTPYGVGIVQLENDIKIPGMISGIELDQIKAGMELKLDFDGCINNLSWPTWHRYCFKPT